MPDCDLIAFTLMRNRDVYDTSQVIKNRASLTPYNSILKFYHIRKIKLAFRPGNVDLADTQSATLAIDDPRFFGNIVPDQDYPELEDIAFSQNMLSNFVSLQAALPLT